MRSIRTLFTVLFIAMGLCSIAMFSITDKVAALRTESRQLNDELYRFYRLSQELKQSSDHLTKFARAYASTGDEKWLNLFNYVLSVRNGSVPLPKGNEYEFWDVVAQNKLLARSLGGAPDNPSLLDRMRLSGIESVEFLELKNALTLSDSLVSLEREAFMAIKGWKKNSQGEFVDTGEPDLELARAILYGDQYFAEKAKIMQAIGSAHQSIMQRMEQNIQRADSEALRYEWINLALVLTLLSVIIASFVLLWRLYINPLSQLLKTVVTQVKREDYAFTITQTAYAELQHFIDSLNVVFHHIAEQLSQNTLLKDFNIILRKNDSTDRLCNEVTQFLLHQFPLEMVGMYIYQEGVLKRVAGVGYGEHSAREYTDPSSTQLSVLLSGQPYAMKALDGNCHIEFNGGKLVINEVYYLPLHVNQHPVALLELGTIGSLSSLQFQWLSQMLDDLSVSIQLSQNIEIQRRAEQKVLEQSQLNQEILDATPNPMYCLSASGTYLTINAKFMDLVGLSAEQIIGKSPQDIFQNETATIFAQVHKRLGEEQSSQDYELSLYDASHHKREMLVYEASFQNNRGEVSGIVGILLDLTDRKQMEEQLREAKETADAMSQAKGDFLANMSHEIRTPMNAILGMAHLALNTELNPTQQKYISRINESAKNLLGIINDILDFSKIEAGKLNVEHIDFSLDEVLDNLTTLISLKAQEKNIEFLLDIDPHIPVGLVGDPLRLGQVLVNLCGNAVKFTERGEIIVSARVVGQNDANVTLKFTVSDTGIGIAESNVATLFSAFSQADNSITRQYGGTGLGLSISKQLVGLMGGDIQVRSEEGSGSTFEFTVECGLQEAKMRDIAKPLSALAGKRALVVDDNDSARNILMTLLNAMHFEAKSVSNGFEALDEIRNTHFDMLFIDWNMPGMNGIELLQRMKPLGVFDNTKRFLVTAYGREISLVGENSKLVDALIVKPVNPSNLLDAIMDSYGIEQLRQSHEYLDHDTRPTFIGQKVLLVEDNEVNQEVAFGLLESTQLSIVLANNGQEALTKLQQEAFDLVLMDMQMPIMDGISATKEIRQHEEWKTLPIVAMTANAMSSDVEHCLNAGMNDHVAKPIDVQRLYHVLRKYLKADETTPVPSTVLPNQVKPSTGYPELTGIDVEQAIFRIGGNAQRYFEILDHFLASQQQEIAAFPKLIDKGLWEEAERVMHTLKGSAANLGIEPIAQLANEMEGVVQRHTKPAIQDLNTVSKLMSTLLDELRDWEQTQLHPQQEHRDIALLYQQLVQCVENYDADAIHMIHQIKQCNLWSDEQKKSLMHAIEDFDFEAAKEVLAQLPVPTEKIS
ncbi:response regulator [Vibrio anguillarum]|uniref:response regulator n=1 Tax=Vibrio anguillarum TaxID=55601 RepID=UPI001C9C211A|nr:response regulator [Vibrio anguillarum]MBY7667093.1 response regulator [Vibrio anguillarum]